MPNAFKHNIIRWMDLTKALSNGAYRTFHVIAESVIENDGPITIAERALAGLSNQSLRSFRKHLQELQDAGLVTLTGDRLSAITDFASAWKRTPLSKALRQSIMERDGFACVYCGTAEDPFEIDHVRPVSRGGFDHPSNLVTACFDCNRSKGTRTPEEWRS